MRLRILSRASDLARLQAMLVERAVRAAWPGLETTLVTRATQGDRDSQTPLSTLTDKGAFTADLSEALVGGDADVVVHSWKDLPLVCRPETMIAATLERADPRDVLLVRRAVVAQRPARLTLLSSAPRREWLIGQSLPALLPWPVETTQCLPVRGNVPTRLAKLVAGAGDGLIVAKAALDRLLGFGPPFEDVAEVVRRALDVCHWMVLPLQDQPGAPAQGALAVEIAARQTELRDRLRAISHVPTWQAVESERAILAAYGGGCHQAVGATVLPREYGRVTSVRAHPDSGGSDVRWLLSNEQVLPPRATAAGVWPRPDERGRAERRSLDVSLPRDDAGLWVSRSEALPSKWTVSPDRLVWAAGGQTWRRLAARGVWVNGCADGLGDEEEPGVDLLAGRDVRWRRLTHQAAAIDGDRDAMATYVVGESLPDDLPARTHLFWTSGSLFVRALAKSPELKGRWHASGPGRTRRVIRETLGADAHVSVWLDYEQWYDGVTR